MNLKIKNLILLICSGLVIMLTLSLFSRKDTIEVNIPSITVADAQQYQEESKVMERKRKHAAEARRMAELEEVLYKCQTDSECIIVDRDSCGCLNGPDGVQAINAAFSAEFAQLIEKEFAAITSCREVGSTERECSESARPVCEQNHCRIVY